MEVNIIRNSIKGAAVLLGTALVMVGCQRESLVAESDVQYDGKVKFAPGVAGIIPGVRSSVSEAASAAARTQSLTLTSEDGKFTLPASLSVTSLEAGRGTKADLLINETGGITPDGIAEAISKTFWVAAWNIPTSGAPTQCIPDDDYALAEDEDGNPDKYGFVSGGYVSGNDDDGYYQKVLYRESHGASGGHYWMTVQPQTVTVAGAPTDADDEYIWQEDREDRGKNKGVIKTFYAYANIPSSSMKLLPDGAGQTMTCTGVPSQDILMGYYNGNGGGTGTASIQFKHPLAAVKFKTGTLASGVTISSVAIENVYGSGELMVSQSPTSFTWTRADGDAFKDANLLPKVDAACDGDAVLVIPQSFPSKARIRVTIEQDGEPEPFNIYTPLTGSWSAGTLYTYTIGYNPELLSGKFSISPTEYVQFSRGNLFCTRSGEEGAYDYKFGFEDYQYDYRTRDGIKAVIDGEELTSTPSGTSGLFLWKTASAVAGSDFGAFATDEDVRGNEGTDILDWGKAFGNNSRWVTLTGEEWRYLIQYHTPKSCTVAGVNGYVIAPDGSTATIADTYTVVEWGLAEANYGLLFLPDAGYYKNGQPNYLQGEYAIYWSSTCKGEYGGQDYNSVATCLCLKAEQDDAFYGVHNYWLRTNGYAVRLAQKFSKPGVEHEFVDLGLSVQWATCNIGASKPEDSGTYFAWGDVKGQTATTSGTGAFSTDFEWNNTPFNSRSATCNTDYFNSVKSMVCPGGILAPEYDAVRFNWGGTCHMPTAAEFGELVNNTDKEWTDNYNETGVSGYIFRNKNDASLFIFLPAAGHGYLKDLKESGVGFYWSSSSGSNVSDGSRFIFEKSNLPHIDNSYRCNGHSIRPVKNAE